jgi:hypothetical protein
MLPIAFDLARRSVRERAESALPNAADPPRPVGGAKRPRINRVSLAALLCAFAERLAPASPPRGGAGTGQLHLSTTGTPQIRPAVTEPDHRP